MKAKQRGFTLTELVVTMTIVGILLALGAPSYKYVTTANRISGEVNGLLGDMQFARSEAIKEGQTVSVCSSTDGATCSGNSSWAGGWLVFTDTGTIGTIDGTDQILRASRALTSGDTFSASSNVSAVTFTRDGFGRNLPATGVTLTLHNSTNVRQYTRCLQLTIIGAMTTETAGQGNCT